MLVSPRCSVWQSKGAGLLGTVLTHQHTFGVQRPGQVGEQEVGGECLNRAQLRPPGCCVRTSENKRRAQEVLAHMSYPGRFPQT